jgi:tripartite-type tricarboxylate transporter receptor subunit TctC
VIANYSEAAPQVLSGKLRALAVGSRERLESMKDVPSLAELGFDGVDGTIWFGLVGPAGVPKAVVERIQAGVERALRSPALRGKLEPQGLFAQEMGAEQFGVFLRGQNEKYQRLIRLSGMKGG